LFKHILVPTDLSHKAELAFTKAVVLAHQFGSEITLLNVHEEFQSKDELIMSRVSVDNLQEKYRSIALDSKNKMKKLITELHAEDIKVHVLLREGKPSKEIINVAEELQSDLIVIGTNGRDGLADYLLGTTTNNVIENSNIPVLVVPE
jgi:nucleotide-binding universal stress UspA family protein